LCEAVWLLQDRAAWSKTVFGPKRFLTKEHEEEEEDICLYRKIIKISRLLFDIYTLLLAQLRNILELLS